MFLSLSGISAAGVCGMFLSHRGIPDHGARTFVRTIGQCGSCLQAEVHVTGKVSCMFKTLYLSVYWTNLYLPPLDLLVELFPWVAVPTGNHGVGSHPTLFWGVTGSHVSGAAALGKGWLSSSSPASEEMWRAIVAEEEPWSRRKRPMKATSMVEGDLADVDSWIERCSSWEIDADLAIPGGASG
uniref:Uncharacterized protein n=1 Tax=Ananas comosus var. bracteatus TaxID=296719 RepID=A0A6V7P278_ANACO|nr:unnamed protein product [Ananas comosus var. bracteatus]